MRFPKTIRTLQLSALLAAVTAAGVFIPATGPRAANPEGRAVWVTRWAYTTGTGSTYPSSHKARIRRILDRAVEGRFNVIVLQIRGQCDAYYASSYEPWAYELTGTHPSSLGNNPGWDPLAYAIDQAHQRGLELHAWLNTFNAWRGTTPPPWDIEPEHQFNLHPEWICADVNHTPMTLSSDYVSFSPGNPEVIEHTLNVALDVLERYDVDGIHFDYIRYPTSVYSRDAVTDSLFTEDYGYPPDQDEDEWKSWQRDRITDFLQSFYYQAQLIKPMAKISAAVIGRYNVPSSGWDGYNIVYQDARLWASRGIIDYLAPMIYWNMDEFDPLIEDWTHYSYGRHVYAGIGAYKADEFGGWGAIEDQIDTSRAEGAEGVLFFQSTSFDRSDGYYWTWIGQNSFQHPATVPPMWWKDPIPPEPPVNLQIASGDTGNVLTWEPPPEAADGDGAEYYGVYRTTGTAVDVNDPGQLLHLTPGAGSGYTDAAAQPGVTYRYAVTAYDKGDNESAPGGEVTTAVEIAGDDRLPAEAALHQNYPNPFNAQTTIEFELSEAVPSVSLQIYNILGQRVVTLLDETLAPGRYRVTWDGTDRAGNRAASGIYFCRLRAGDWSRTSRMILLR